MSATRDEKRSTRAVTARGGSSFSLGVVARKLSGAFLAAGLLVWSPGIHAADLPGRGGPVNSCLIAERSPLLDLPTSEIFREVDFRYGRAVATSKERVVIASARPVFPWALEARVACATAIGYLKGAVVDDVSISKCDCFHDRMIGNFR